MTARSGQTGAAKFDPAALFAKTAGAYTFTFEADESCPLPPSLKVLTYDVLLEPTRFRYLAVRVPGKDFVGDLWALAREEDGFAFRWNVDCEAPTPLDRHRSTSAVRVPRLTPTGRFRVFLEEAKHPGRHHRERAKE